MNTRLETDSLGEVSLPADALYGSNTQRGLQNFPTSGITIGDEPQLVEALALIKKSCVLSNVDLGVIDAKTGQAIAQACDIMLSGELNQHLVVPLIEGSGGTSTNMNVNEVLANQALLLLGRSVGDYESIHPNDHINCGQSTNDVVPSAMKLATYHLVDQVIVSLDKVVEALARKSSAFSEVYRLGRTCLQDGQPMTLGQAFSGYVSVISRASERIRRQQQCFLAIPLGGTAIGTGLGSAKGFRGGAFAHLKTLTGLAAEPSGNRFDGMQNLDEFQRLSAELETATAALAKIAKDFMLLSSGPVGGLGEITLPSVQPGSSIMPGKVNPVIAMSVVQLSQMVHGNHSCIAMACQDGMLEINHYEHSLASRLFDSLHLTTDIAASFADLCIDGIEANAERSMANLQNSFALATTFVPKLGYNAVSKLVKESLQCEETFLELAQQRQLITESEILDQIKRSVLVDND